MPALFYAIATKMSQFFIIFNALLPVFLITFVGFLLKWKNFLTDEAVRSLLKIIVNVLSPCLIMDIVMGNEALKRSENLLAAPLWGVLTVLIGLLLGKLLVRVAGVTGKEKSGERRIFIASMGLYNYVYVSLPLCISLYDTPTLGVLFVFNVGVECTLWTVVISVMNGYSPLKEWKKILNMPLFAMIIAETINLTIGVERIPVALIGAFHHLGACTVPIGLLISGATMYNLCREHSVFGNTRIILTGSILKMAVIPIIFILAIRWLPMSFELKRVILLQSTMPVGFFILVLANYYGANLLVGFRMIMTTTALCLFTVPIWIHYGSKFLGI